jgi:hypothetical protein
MLQLLHSMETLISELVGLVKLTIANMAQIIRATSISQANNLQWVRSDLREQTGGSDLVRERPEEMKRASSPSNPVCFRCGVEVI